MKEEFFIVVPKRTDNSLPSLVKAIEERIFFLKEEAEEKAEQLSREYPMVFCVCCCEGEVREIMGLK